MGRTALPKTAISRTALPRTALDRTAQNFALFFTLPPHFSFFPSLGGCFKAPGPCHVHVGLSGCGVKPRRLLRERETKAQSFRPLTLRGPTWGRPKKKKKKEKKKEKKTRKKQKKKEQSKHHLFDFGQFRASSFQSAGPLNVDRPPQDRTQFRSFFPLPTHFSFFLPSLGGLLVEYLVVFLKAGTLECARLEFSS